MAGEEAQRLMYEARLYGEQLRLLENEIERISIAGAELGNSLRAIEALKEDTVFVPVGGGSLVSGKITSTDVLVPVGGGYLMSMKKYEAIEEVKKRVKSTETAVERLRGEFDKINIRLRDVSGKIDAMNVKFNPQRR